MMESPIREQTITVNDFRVTKSQVSYTFFCSGTLMLDQKRLGQSLCATQPFETENRCFTYSWCPKLPERLWTYVNILYLTVAFARPTVQRNCMENEYFIMLHTRVIWASFSIYFVILSQDFPHGYYILPFPPRWIWLIRHVIHAKGYVTTMNWKYSSKE